jgi:ATP-dependent DNA helicase RecG
LYSGERCILNRIPLQLLGTVSVLCTPEKDVIAYDHSSTFRGRLCTFTFISTLSNILSNPIEYLKGVGPQRAELLKKELQIFTFRDLLEHFPYRHVDRTKISLIREIRPDTEYIQIAGKLSALTLIGERRGRRLTAELKDASGVLQLVWFQGISWIERSLKEGSEYLVYGKVSFFNGSRRSPILS